MSNAKNSLTILLGITIIASVGIVSSVTVSFAIHDLGQPSWSSSTHTYKCLSNLYSLADNTVSECTDFGLATDYWDDVSSSNWYFYHSYSGEVEVGGANLGSGTTVAQTTITNNWGTITDAQIEFNNQKTFTDATITSTSSYDWISVSVHETGHVLKLAHEYLDGDSPMYHYINEDQVRRTLSSHDVSVIQGKY